MKLIFITQKLAYNDPLMGFTHAWVSAFARQVDELVVITNELGELRIPEKIRTYSLGKELGHSKWQKTYLLNQIIQAESDADAIFCHQCPIYILSSLPTTLLKRIPLYLWYAHGHLSKSARLASYFVKKVFTSSPYALTLYNHKKQVIGQGVEIESWKNEHKVYDSRQIRMTHVGRLSEVKNIVGMIHLTAELKKKGYPVILDLIGDPATDADTAYTAQLKSLTQDYQIGDSVRFLGGMPHGQIKEVLKNCDFTLNFSTSAAIDKSLIETTAAGLFPISYNQSFLYTIKGTPLESIYQQHKTAIDLIEFFFKQSLPQKTQWQSQFVQIMKSKHDLGGLAGRIVREMKNK